MEKENIIFIDGNNIERIFSDDLSPFLKWGLSCLLSIGIAILGVSYLFKWPEVLKASCILTSSESPKEIFPKSQAKLIHIYFMTCDSVEKGSVIGILDNNAKYKEVLQLEKLINLIDSIYQDNLESVVKISVDYFQQSNLGDIQPSYEQFLKSYSELKFELSDVFLANKLFLLSQRKHSLIELNLNLRLQRNTIFEDYEIANNTFENEKKLFEKGAVSAFELKGFESIMLTKRLSFQNIKNIIIQNERQQQDLLEQKIQLIKSIEIQKNGFIQSFKNLKSVLNQWKNNYLLISPIKGILSIPNSTQVDGIISPQISAFYVLPINAKPIIQIVLPQYKISAVAIGKITRIKLTGYPYEEFGVLEGNLLSVSKIPIKGTYEGFVELPKGLRTSFGKKIDFIHGLEGEAEILLKDEILIKRLFRKITGKK